MAFALQESDGNRASLGTAGVTCAHRIFPTSEIAEKIQNAGTVDIVQTWIPDIVPLLKSMRECLSGGGSARIALMDPDCVAAKQRSIDIGYDRQETAAHSIRLNISELKRFWSDYVSDMGSPPSLEVRIYSALPSASLYRYDSVAYIGLYLAKTPAIQGPQIEVNVHDGYYGNAILEHMEHTWKTSAKVNLT